MSGCWTGCLHSIHHAVQNNDVRGLRTLLDSRIDPNLPCRVTCSTPLHYWAGKANNSECLEILLKAKADVNGKDWYRQTPLRDAVYEQNTYAVNLLIENKADVNHVENGLLFLAFRYSRTLTACELMVQTLLDEGIHFDNNVSEWIDEHSNRHVGAYNLYCKEYKLRVTELGF